MKLVRNGSIQLSPDLHPALTSVYGNQPLLIFSARLTEPCPSMKQHIFGTSDDMYVRETLEKRKPLKMIPSLGANTNAHSMSRRELRNKVDLSLLQV